MIINASVLLLNSRMHPIWFYQLVCLCFCYLGDRLSVDGDANAAVETRI